MAKKKIKGKKELEKEKRLKAKVLIKSENKILRNFLLGLGGFIIVLVIFFVSSGSSTTFEYHGVDFEIVEEGALTLYRTDLPVISNGEQARYNFFLRNDPRDLESIEFDGEINLLPNMVIDSKESFNCDGDGVIAIANLLNLYNVLGTNVVKNDDLDCSLGNEYIYLDLQNASKTKIIQPVRSCYAVLINNCEILPATEKFLVETLIKVNRDILNGN